MYSFIFPVICVFMGSIIAFFYLLTKLCHNYRESELNHNVVCSIYLNHADIPSRPYCKSQQTSAYFHAHSAVQDNEHHINKVRFQQNRSRHNEYFRYRSFFVNKRCLVVIISISIFSTSISHSFHFVGHHVVLHSVTNLLDNDKKSLKIAYFFGSAIPADVYIAWISFTALVLSLRYEGRWAVWPSRPYLLHASIYFHL